MQWKDLGQHPLLIAFTICGTSLGILVDFQGALTSMSSVWPAVQAFLPVLMIPVAIFSGAYLLFCLPGVCYRAIYNRLPSVKWGRQYADIIHRRARECEKILYVEQTAPGMFVELTRLAESMAVYRIPCPPVRNNLNCIGEWTLFLAKLSGYADTHNLKAARRLWLDIKSSSDA